ncbi:DUF481 domain-containing protein [Pontibacter ruber]|uniref:DUF481 domain-containing protein n=1 Tax=Pontibacter ruber TaxID=1343895 RepID=A0ABW5CSC8_9BACT|nr:DUF481 domain-containing protein [Pontibacter ruber]
MPFRFNHSLLIILLFKLFLATPAAKAQILNIERARVERDDTINYFTGKGGLNFSMFNRNAGKNNPNNFLQLTLTGDVAFITAKHSYLLLNYYNYLLINYDNREQRNTIASNGYSHLRVNFYRKRKLSYELFTQFQADLARGLERRVLTGGGLRYALLRREKATIFAGTGLMHEHERWNDPEQEGAKRVSDLPKSTNYLSLKAKLTEQVETNSIAYYQTGYDKSIDRFRNRVSGDVGLNVKLSDHVSLRTNFSCTYEDRPIIPITRFIYAITNGIQVGL